MNGHKTQQENPQPTGEEGGTRQALETERKIMPIDVIVNAKKQAKERTRTELKNLKKGLFGPTLEAREGSDYVGYKYSLWLKRVEKQLNEFEDKQLRAFDSLIPQKELTPAEYKEFLDQVQKANDNFAKETTMYQQVLLASVKALMGTSNKLDRTQMAMLDTLLDNVNTLYSRDIKITQTFLDITNDTITDTDWRVICENIKKYPLSKTVNKDKDKINLSVTGLFISIMTPNQRFELVQKFHEYNGNNIQDTQNLIQAMSQTMLINKTQHEELMSKIMGQNYTMTPDEERKLLLAQEEVKRVTRGVRDRMNTPLLINGAERLLNRKTIVAGLLTVLGTAGAVMNWATAFNSAHGQGIVAQMTAGLTKPYTWLGVGVAGLGIHKLGKDMRPGESVGWFENVVHKPKALTNPFGVDKTSNERNRNFDELTETFANYGLFKDFMYQKHNGFGYMQEFLQKKNLDLQKAELEAKVKEKPKKPGEKPKKDFYEDFTEFVSKEKKDAGGTALLQNAEKFYGKMKAREILFKMFTATRSLGIISADGFKKQNIPGQQFTHYQLMRHRQGLEKLKTT